MMSVVRASLRSRFQGCMVGGVIGDCVGAPFEMTGSGGSTHYVERFAKKIPTRKPGSLEYTDDTAMARSVAASLIENKGEFNAKDMAKRFSSEYKKEPGRGYGGNVISVFDALDDDKLEDVFAPAKKQFDGSGSYGNGGAMRVAPVGLCTEERFIQMIKIAKESAQITHSNALGYNGAILQACAVHLALNGDPKKFDRCDYVDKLIGITVSQEQTDPTEGLKGAKRARVSLMGREVSDDTDDELTDDENLTGVYCDKLRVVKRFLEHSDDGKHVTMDEVVEHLGNRISAHYSVTTAVYCFLHGMRPMKDFPEFNAFERTILYAITLDGDTDTIASMAGAIAGAYYGMDVIPKPWIKACEGTEEALKLADGLYDIMVKEEALSKENKDGAVPSDGETTGETEK